MGKRLAEERGEEGIGIAGNGSFNPKSVFEKEKEKENLLDW